MKSALREKFRAIYGRSPEIVTRAPGRLEFIGNHTDYNGGTVLGAAIDRSIWVGLARREDGRRRFSSNQRDVVIEREAGDFTKQSGAASWLNYPLGVLDAFATFYLRAPAGFDYLAMADLPAGAGLSSSAAIELASALAFAEAAGERPSREVLVKASRHAENHFVGVPCGILDQGCSGFGKKDHLVFIDCRGPHFDTVPLPAGAHFWVFNTHTKHALVDGLYAARHRECMEAAQALGVPLLVEANIAALAAADWKMTPTAAKRARHIIEEIARVDATVEALRAGKLDAVGKLLTASHRSSQALFENSTGELDFLVDTLTAMPDVYGARLTGGGFGGAVMALASGKFDELAANRVAAAYKNKFSEQPDILHMQTGDGAQVIAPELK